MTPAETFQARIQATETIVPKGNTVTDLKPFVIDIEGIRLDTCRADPAVRSTLTEALREYLADLGLFDRLHNLLDTRAARDKIRAKGYRLSVEAHEQAFEQHSSPEAREAVINDLRTQARARLDAAADPINRRTAGVVIEHIEADLAKLPQWENLHCKYLVSPPTVLRQGMERALARLRADIAPAFSTGWHPDAVQRFSQVFGIDFAAELNPPPAPTATAPASPAPAAGTLRTAADVAAART